MPSMSKLAILTYPHPRLRKRAEEVREIAGDLRTLADDLLETMYAAPGIGLAATQVGVLKRVIVMDCSGDKEAREPQVLVNPAVVGKSDDIEVHEEGCLSLPGHFADVKRPAEVTVEFTGICGEARKEDFAGLWARCVQHEIDHLDGILFIDRISKLKRELIKRKIRKEIRERAKGGA